MVMSLAKMCAGAGVDYMLRNIARGDGTKVDVGQSLAAYYAASGYPPGVWLGTGLAGLNNGRGISPGSEVTEEGMRRLFGQGTDPVTGTVLGRPMASGSVRSVIGFDLTFSVPKSVSVVWGLAGPDTRAAIMAAHHEAIGHVLHLVERDVARTRIGAGGAIQIPVAGIVAAAFDHFDSRAGDPQLHTHVTVANRVQAADGRWRTLYGARLYRSAVAMSEAYDAILADTLTRNLGVGWQWRDRGVNRNPVRELASVPQVLIDEFSQRARRIDAAKNAAVAKFVAKHGRQPSATEVIKLRQQATLSTREAKQVKPLNEHIAEWRNRAADILAVDGTDAVATWVDRQMQTAPASRRLSRAEAVTDTTVERAAATVLDAVEAKRATWTEWNIHAEAARVIAQSGTVFVAAEDLIDVRDRIATAAAERSVLLNPAEPGLTVGTGIVEAEPSAQRQFTSLEILAAEDRLLTAANATTGPVADPLPEHGSHSPVDVVQRRAVAAIVSSGRVADVLVGPAGTGKSTTMRLLRETWENTHGAGSVVGLAPSTAAARVLGNEIEAAAETTAQWIAQQRAQGRRLDQLAEMDRRRERRADAGMPTADLDEKIATVHSDYDRWALAPGRLVIVDEAGMADTKTLDNLVAHATLNGAKVVLVGDPAQLGAVGAGGAFAMLTRHRTDAPELVTVRRFKNPDGTDNRAEAKASILLRDGNPEALDYYRRQGRIHTPAADTADAAYAAWKSDRDSGLESLLIAADNATVTELNRRAHDDAVAAGTVTGDGVRLAEGNRAGIGDRIVTRKVDRHLPDGTSKTGPKTSGALRDGYVTNGAMFTVTGHTADGGLLARADHGREIALPATYVARHVQLGYATTAHRAQGATVDTAHVIATDRMAREMFYVAMTRGRYANHAWINTEPAAGSEIDRPAQDAGTIGPDEVLYRILTTTANPRSAHDTARDLQRETARQRAEVRLPSEQPKPGRITSPAIDLPASSLAEIANWSRDRARARRHQHRPTGIGR